MNQNGPLYLSTPPAQHQSIIPKAPHFCQKISWCVQNFSPTIPGVGRSRKGHMWHPWLHPWSGYYQDHQNFCPHWKILLLFWFWWQPINWDFLSLSLPVIMINRANRVNLPKGVTDNSTNLTDVLILLHSIQNENKFLPLVYFSIL